MSFAENIHNYFENINEISTQIDDEKIRSESIASLNQTKSRKSFGFIKKK